MNDKKKSEEMKKILENSTDEEAIKRGREVFEGFLEQEGMRKTEGILAQDDLMLLIGRGKIDEFESRLEEIRKEAERDIPLMEELAGTMTDAIYQNMGDKPAAMGMTPEEMLEHFSEVFKESEDPGKEAAKTLNTILKEILETAKAIEGLEDSVTTKGMLEIIQAMQRYLENGFQQEELDKFIKGEKEFMVTARPAGVENLLKINTKYKDKVSLREFKNGKVRLQGRIGIDEQKISEMIRIAFKNQNFHGASKGLNRTVVLSVTDVMEILGRTNTPENRKWFARQLRDKMLPDIAHQRLEIRFEDGSFWQIDIGGSERKVNMREDRIYFDVSEKYAEYLSKATLSQYNSKTLRLGSQKKPLPYYLAVKLQDHYFHDGNRTRNTHNILSIKTILQFCEEVLPSYDYIQRTDPGHWVDRIKEPLEEALEDIKNIGLFEWEYCKKAMGDITEQERNTRDYLKWSELYITFRLIPEEPDQTERLTHKQERIEAAQEKKELREAQIIVEADKIQKRKARRKKKQDSDAPEESKD